MRKSRMNAMTVWHTHTQAMQLSVSGSWRSGLSSRGGACVAKLRERLGAGRRGALHAAESGGGAIAAKNMSPASSVSLLVLVAALYGSLSVCLRALFALPGPPTPAALSVVRQVVTVACFAPILLQSKRASAAAGEKAPKLSSTFWLAGAELAFWNFGAQGLCNAGLALTSATRASFFTQLSVVLTPIISLAAGQTVAPAVKGACALALGGVLLLGGDGPGPEVVAAPLAAGASVLAKVANACSNVVAGFSTGDILCLAGAACWSMYIFRVSAIGRRKEKLPDVELQAAKTFLMVALYSVWCGVDWIFVRKCPLVALWPGWRSANAWAILLFSGLLPGAFADVWMQKGSSGVSASTTNVLLSAEPLFAAAFANILLGEVLGPKGLIGGALIVTAAVLAGVLDRPAAEQ